MKTLLSVIIAVFSLSAFGAGEAGKYAKAQCLGRTGYGPTFWTLLTADVERIDVSDNVYYEIQYQGLDETWTQLSNPECKYEIRDLARGNKFALDDENGIVLSKSDSMIRRICGAGSFIQTFPSKDSFLKAYRRSKVSNVTIDGMEIRRDSAWVSHDSCVVDKLEP